MAKSVWQKFINVIVTGDLRLNSNAEIKIDDGAGTVTTVTPTELNTLDGITASTAELNQVADASARVVATTATALSLTVTEHADRVLLVNTNSTVANTFTLPLATGSGNKYTIRNNIAQTQGTVVIAANGTTNVLDGRVIAVDTTAVSDDVMSWATSATSDKISLDLTTTGGLRYDTINALDVSTGVYLVDGITYGSGDLATPFSAT